MVSSQLVAAIRLDALGEPATRARSRLENFMAGGRAIDELVRKGSLV